MAAEDDAVQAMADAFFNDPDLHPDVKDNLADVTSPAYVVVPAAPDPESFHALRVIIRGFLNYFGENGRLVPPKAIVPFNLSSGDITTYFTSGLGNAGSPYENWAICDGANGTPDLRNKFIRSTDGAAGGTGGSDTHTHTMPTHFHTMPSHSHTVDSHTHSVPNHIHTMPSHSHRVSYGWDSGSEYLAGASTPFYGSVVYNPGTNNRRTRPVPGITSGNVRSQLTQSVDPGDTNNSGATTTGGTSPGTNSVDPGDTNATDPGDTNSASSLPSYHQLTYLMRVA